MINTRPVVYLNATQIENAAGVLARAFQDDPITCWLIPDAVERARLMPHLFTTSVRYGYRFGEVYSTTEPCEGSAVWLVPGQTTAPPHRMIQTGVLRMALHLRPGSIRRLLIYVDYVERMQLRAIPEPHWYLFLLGVEPIKQGQGIGGALLQPILSRADQMKLPCYLETALERDLRFYERYGFKLHSETDIPGGGPHLWLMIRPAS